MHFSQVLRRGRCCQHGAHTLRATAPQPRAPMLGLGPSSSKSIAGWRLPGPVASPQGSCDVCSSPLRDVKIGRWVREVTARFLHHKVPITVSPCGFESEHAVSSLGSVTSLGVVEGSVPRLPFALCTSARSGTALHWDIAPHPSGCGAVGRHGVAHQLLTQPLSTG